MREHPADPRKPKLVSPLFEIATAEQGDGVVILVKGELDLFDRPRLEAAMGAAEASRSGTILIDLEELTFIDAAGLSSLFDAQGRSIHNGDRLRITPGRGSVAKLLRLAGLDAALPLAAAEVRPAPG